PHLGVQQYGAERRRRGAQRDEDESKPGHEPPGVDQRGAAPHFELFEGEAREEPHVARNEGQDAGREEAQQSGDERDGKGGRHPQKQTAETTVVQRPSSPHSAVDVTFIVRTMNVTMKDRKSTRLNSSDG